MEELDLPPVEIVSLPNGRFTIQPVGEGVSPNDKGEFDTLPEAENALFLRAQRSDANANDLHVLKPGQGQGIA